MIRLVALVVEYLVAVHALGRLFESAVRDLVNVSPPIRLFVSSRRPRESNGGR